MIKRIADWLHWQLIGKRRFLNEWDRDFIAKLLNGEKPEKEL